MADEPAIVILAGGHARRFPDKLEHPIGGRPMIAHLYERARATGLPVYIVGKGSFSRELDARLDAPLLVDRLPDRGPLGALLSACATIRAQRLFALAADQPLLEMSLLERLEAAWEMGDEAAVPEHDGEIEPLAALYARSALLREGFEMRRAPRRAMRDLIERVATRFVACDGAAFHNVNRIGDLP